LEGLKTTSSMIREKFIFNSFLKKRVLLSYHSLVTSILYQCVMYSVKLKRKREPHIIAVPISKKDNLFKYVLFLPYFFCHSFSVMLFLSFFFCHAFSVMFFCHVFLSCFFCHAFSVMLFLSCFLCHTFSVMLLVK
jgi:hypothetical protein